MKSLVLLSCLLFAAPICASIQSEETNNVPNLTSVIEALKVQLKGCGKCKN